MASIYPDQNRTAWILRQRPGRSVLDPFKPYHFFLEHERASSGRIVESAGILLTNKECPWHCLMCDLWKDTLTDTVPAGAIPRQIEYALAQLQVRPEQLKLYNSGSFFDPAAIPPQEYGAIARGIDFARHVIVESHPRLVGPRALRLRDLLEGSFEVAMGLETVHPEILPRLNKRFTLEQFARATAFLREEGIRVRAFVLVKPPFLEESEAVRWAVESARFAFSCGVDVVSLIPTRPGNGALDRLMDSGEFAPPSLEVLERSLEQSLQLQTGRVFADMWDLQRFSTCSVCFSQREQRLERMNLTQTVAPPVQCSACGAGRSNARHLANVTLRFLVFLCWLLAFQVGAADLWQSCPGGRYREVGEIKGTKPGFVRLPSSQTGVRFNNVLSQERYLTNTIYLNGSGVALGDVDGDGRCDIFLGGIGGHSALYRNLGDWKFEDITEKAGVGAPGLSVTGAALVDLDGDGHLDLVLNTIGQGTHIYLNDGKGVFTEITKAAPLNPGKAGQTVALADIDGDGKLDMYIANYRTETLRDKPMAKFHVGLVNGKQTVLDFEGRRATEPELVGRFEVSDSGRVIENGEPDVLYHNEGGAKFTAVSFTGGAFLDEDGKPLTSPPYDWGLSAMFRDLNGDGAPDLYVCNDFESPDRIWINDGKGKFRAISRLAFRHTSIFSMGVDVGDLNRDGHDDLIVSDMLMQTRASRQLRIADVPPVFQTPGIFDDRPQYSFNNLFVNRGDGTYAELAWFAGVEASGWTWCPVLLDVDLDGYEDILFTTGHEWDMMNTDVINRAEVLKGQRNLSPTEILHLRTMFPRFATPKVAFRNLGNLKFEDVSAAWGFAEPDVSQGIALADLDNDGDLDVVINNLNGEAAIYRNDCPAPRVAVRLKGTAPNTAGIGAKVFLRGGAVPQQSQEMIAGGRYLSSDDPMRVFAAGNLTNVMTLEVRWRSGKRSLLAGVRANRLYELDEAAASMAPADRPPVPQPWFEVVTNFSHRHFDEPFDDFARQPLLPHKLSQLGPGVCWCDLDGDGMDELVIGGGRGGSLGLFHYDGKGGFTTVQEPFLSRTLARDLTGIVGAEGVVLAGSSNYEDGQTNGGCLRIYDLKHKASGGSIVGQPQSVGPLAMADIDGDGDLDLFIGGRAMPGRYPEPADSLLLRNENGRFVIAQRFEKLGMVSGAVFSDINGDGKPDLVLACDWGPVRVFLNQDGRFVEATDALGLGAYKGWWTGVTTGDFDGDGRMDIVACNWGSNHRHRATPQNSQRLYYGDLQGDQAIDLIEATIDPQTGAEVPERGFSMISAALPWIRAKVDSFEAYGKATLKDLYGETLKSAGHLEVNTTTSMVFLNRGDHFEAHPLPPEAQWAPAFGVCVGDFDGDGNEDIFLSQNFFDVPPDEARQDAGRGLWLRGDGKGEFRAMSGQVTGIKIYGEQRGCALSDFDGDGRVDLAVAQNGNATVLYRNVRGHAGLRVRLEGPPGNSAAFGAVLRLRFGSKYGPARELHAGSGYWSQDSATAVLCGPAPPDAIEVRWPGGKKTESVVPAGAREVVISLGGQLRVTKP